MGSLKHIFSFSFKDLLPKTLFKRAFLIIGLPLILVQIVFSVVFLDRYLDSITTNLANNIAQTSKVITDIHEKDSALSSEIAYEMGVLAEFEPGSTLESIENTPLNAWEDQFLNKALRETFDDQPVLLTTTQYTLTVHAQTSKGVMSVSVVRKKLMSRTTILVFIWVFGASLFFLIIALIFMRNQVRPIQRLAEAAEKFGKGMDMADFKVSGASEVRQAAKAFNLMRERIRRQVTQRTDMLAGISHDLRTPLTRIKLELALMEPTKKIDAIKKDIAEMESLIDEYLTFVEGHKKEEKAPHNIKDIIESCMASLDHKKGIKKGPLDSIVVEVRAKSLKRALKNLLENAGRYSTESYIKAYKNKGLVHIVIDDNGAGIPVHQRQEVFKPFVRLEKSRNTKTGGVGLGLSIAQDIVHSHGGQIQLSRSPLGGLRVHVTIPL